MAKNLQDSVQSEMKPLRKWDVKFIHKHFGDVNLRYFRASSDYENQIFRVELNDKMGYYFVGELGVSGSHEKRMELELKKQKKIGKFVRKKFVDYNDHISGFCWEEQ
ncbi:MAG: hypothetical protein WC584_01305 [Candidatus Pacearchaeota archaeon]